MKSLILKCLITAASLSVISFVQAETPSWGGKPFTALQVEFDEALPRKIAKSRVYVSKKGIRVEGISNPDQPLSKIISLYRFKDEKNIIIDPSKKTYVLVEDNGHVEVEDDLGSVLSLKPCDGFKKSQNTGVETLLKRKVEKWACLHPVDDVVVFQYYDPKMKLVIKENIEGQVTELRDIKSQKQKQSLFEIPKGYKKISMAEMMTGYIELNPYQGKK